MDLRKIILESNLSKSIQSDLLNTYDVLELNGEFSNEKEFNSLTNISFIGWVTSVGDGVVRSHGLPGVGIGEKVYFNSISSGITGMVFNIEEHIVSIVVLAKENTVSEGDLIIRSGTSINTRIGSGLLGCILDCFGNLQYTSVYIPLYACEFHEQAIEIKAPSILCRKKINASMLTGLKMIDSMIPIGRGQRELIIGDRQTGKTTIALTAILNQKNLFDSFAAAESISVNYELENEIYSIDWRNQIFCIYVAIGQKRSSVKRLYNVLKRENAIVYTSIVSATASDPAALQYLAPYSGCSLGEYYRDNGKHSLVVYDDLTKHAAAYRQISLLLRRPPGREAYPGDIFYVHSRLLERAAQMSFAKGGGSLTALPVIETQEGDISGYIPTNVISITDGQICLDKDLFNRGLRPAMNIGLSVSRVGSAAQNLAMRQIAGQLKLYLAQYRNLEGVDRFSSEVDPTVAVIINRGSRIMELLKQKKPMSVYAQIISLYAGLNGFLDDIKLNYIKVYESLLLHSELIPLIMEQMDNDTRLSLQHFFSFHLQEEFSFFIEVFGAKPFYSFMNDWLIVYTSYFIDYIQSALNHLDKTSLDKILVKFNF